MAYEPKKGEGALFKNEHKTMESHPAARGYVIAHRDIKAGERLELAAWTKESAKGRFQSLRMSDPREKRDTPVADNTGIGRDDMSDVPF